MTDTPAPSGADLARQALAAARAAAKTRPAPGPKKPRRIRPARGEGRDPMGLGHLLERLTTEQGWTDNLGGGNLIDQWASICPTELASTVQPVAYDADHGILHLRPCSPAYATQLRLFQQQLAKHLNTQLGRPAVRAIRVLPVGATTPAVDGIPEPQQPETPAAPVKTRETASPGYRTVLEAALANKPEKQPTDPYILEAIARQEAALRTHRERDDRFTDAVAEAERIAEPVLDRSAAVRRAALERKHLEATGRTEPRRVFDVA